MHIPVFSMARLMPFHEASMEYFCLAVSGRRGSQGGGGGGPSASAPRRPPRAAPTPPAFPAGTPSHSAQQSHTISHSNRSLCYVTSGTTAAGESRYITRYHSRCDRSDAVRYWISPITGVTGTVTIAGRPWSFTAPLHITASGLALRPERRSRHGANRGRRSATLILS
ncbi:hypothetical protein EVAR_35980_1 [Eumeta japonica]|uniref:Uncharacterized protein n=1 Tax=Eumeta variegata TaxID=151549 RepID=A0A4C1WU56_EUMVA|nr:hypothetical protein EVAR_35980_1 [Eumeta japonica]